MNDLSIETLKQMNLAEFLTRHYGLELSAARSGVPVLFAVYRGEDSRASSCGWWMGTGCSRTSPAAPAARSSISCR